MASNGPVLFGTIILVAITIITIIIINPQETGLSRVVSILAPYWIVNRTDVPLYVRPVSSSATPHATLLMHHATASADLCTSCDVHPLIYGGSTSSVRLSVAGHWSKAIVLEAIGASGVVHMEAPVDAAVIQDLKVCFCWWFARAYAPIHMHCLCEVRHHVSALHRWLDPVL